MSIALDVAVHLPQRPRLVEASPQPAHQRVVVRVDHGSSRRVYLRVARPEHVRWRGRGPRRRRSSRNGTSLPRRSSDAAVGVGEEARVCPRARSSGWRVRRGPGGRSVARRRARTSETIRSARAPPSARHRPGAGTDRTTRPTSGGERETVEQRAPAIRDRPGTASCVRNATCSPCARRINRLRVRPWEKRSTGISMTSAPEARASADRSVLRGRVAHEQLDGQGRIEELCPDGGEGVLEHVRTIANWDRYATSLVIACPSEAGLDATSCLLVIARVRPSARSQ